MKKKQAPMWMSAPLLVGAFGLLLWWENRRPLRREVEAKPRRVARNLGVAAFGAAALQVAERPIATPLDQSGERRGWGLLRRLNLPAWLEAPLAVILLDYTLYIWHVLTHRVPLLWRFHLVHHIDLDLDASTALRFHFGELVASVPWRAGQILLIGVSPPVLSAWQTALLLSIMFHHSNMRLPIKLERWLTRLIITPRMHGIHHSIVEEETNSNWSSGLTLWDYLHGTLRLNVPQADITIGVPAYREPGEVTLPQMLKLPFGPERPTWRLLGDGQPAREPSLTSPDHLLA